MPDREKKVTLLKQLLSWATVLKKIAATFDPLMTESMAKELCQMFRNFSRPETCMEFYMYNVIQLGGSSRADENNIRRFNYWKHGQGVVLSLVNLLHTQDMWNFACYHYVGKRWLTGYTYQHHKTKAMCDS